MASLENSWRPARGGQEVGQTPVDVDQRLRIDLSNRIQSAARGYHECIEHTRYVTGGTSQRCSIPPLHRRRQQLHCPAHKCTLGNAPALSCDVPKALQVLLPSVRLSTC